MHPAITIVELMRLLVDEHKLAWEVAWELRKVPVIRTIPCYQKL